MFPALSWLGSGMKYLGIALIYCSVCCLIGFAIYHIGNAWPLLGLLIFPSITMSSDDEKKQSSS